MLIAVLSDTHDNSANLEAALEICRRRHIATLIHCGDLTKPALVNALAGFEVIYTFGNVDHDQAGLQHALLQINPANRAGQIFCGEVGGRQIAALHGQNENLLAGLIRQNKFAWIFHGHTHRRRDTTSGHTRIVCPGALGGTYHEARSFCVVELENSRVEFIRLED